MVNRRFIPGVHIGQKRQFLAIGETQNFECASEFL